MAEPEEQPQTKRGLSRRWKIALAWLAFEAVAIAGAFLVPRYAHLVLGRTVTSEVVRIIDGDGLVLANGMEIRLGDFDAPEARTMAGKQASYVLSTLVYRRTVECRTCEGARNPFKCTSWDRTIATCRLSGTPIGDLMRAQGVRESGN